MDNMRELLPCPFCGGPVELEKTIDGRKWYGVVCRNTFNRGGTCAVSIRPSASEECAIERWNMRAQSAAVPVVGEVVAYESVGCGGTKSLVRASLLERDPTLRNPDAEYIPLYKSTTVVVSAAELDALRMDAERYHYVRKMGLREAGFKESKILFAAQDEAIDAAIAGEKK